MGGSRQDGFSPRSTNSNSQTSAIAAGPFLRALGGTQVRVVVCEPVILEFIPLGRTLDSAHVRPHLVFLERVANRSSRIAQADARRGIRDSILFNLVPGRDIPHVASPSPAELGAGPVHH